MDNYGNDYFMSQEGYASIDFTLLDRPNSNIASAPESTAALLPDLHVADSSFSSFDFLDGPSVDAFGGVPLDEAHSRDQGGYRYDLQKSKTKERSLLQQSSVGLHRGDGDPESELPSSEFHMQFEVQKPVSNLDFFSQGHTKESGHQEQQQAQSDPGTDATDGNQDYFEQGQMSQQTHNSAGAAGWYNSWPGSNSHGDQTQVFLQNPSYEEASDERRLVQMKGNSAQLAGQMGYQTPQVPSTDSVPRPTHSFLQTTHSFLPTAKQSDSRQASNMGLGLPSAQGNAAGSSVVNKSNSRHQAFDYEGLMNGSSANQFRQTASAAVENPSAARRHQTSDATVGGQDALRGHSAQSQNYNKYTGQNLGAMAQVEVSPLKVNDYDFLGGQQYALKGQAQGEIGGHQQLAVDEMQAWHQHPLLSQSNQQQTAYQQHAYQDLPRHHQQQHVDQQSQQNARQQHVQQFMAANHQNQSLGNQLSAFLTESSLQEIPRVPERQTSQVGAVDSNSRALLQTSYPAINNNATNLNWQSATPDPSAMEGLAHDYLMGAGDQNFNWQALALKASQQVDPQAVYGSLPVNRRDTLGGQQQQIGAYQQAMQGGSTFQDYYGASGKITGANAQVEKPVARNLGGSEDSGPSLYGGAYQTEVYDASGNLHASAQSSKHQALGKMPFWQNPYPHQSVEQNRSGNSLGQTNLPPRSPQMPAATQSRQQRNWSALSGQQEAHGLQGGIFAQNLANAEALKQSILAGSSIQQSSRQAAADLRPSVRTQSSIEAAHYMQQQSSSQAASGSQFLSALSTKQQQNNWNRLNLQQSVPQAAEAPSTLEANQKSNWTSLNIQQAGAESQSLANLNKQQNLWGGHNAQQGSRPAANSLHLFTDLDGRRNSMQNSHDLQQGTTQQASKIDVNLHSSHNIQSSSVQGNEPPNTLLDLETSQQSGWRDHSLLQGTSQTNNSLQAYNELDKTSSWRNIWQTPSSGEASSQLLEMDDGRHQQSTLWGHSLQKSRSEAAAINPREQQQSAWSSQDVQQDAPQTDQLLSSLDAEQQQGGSRHSHSHTLDDRHQTGQFGHLLHEERASHSKTSADVDARHTATQSVYSLQSQVAATEQDVRHKAIHNAYSLQSQVAMTETDSRHKSTQDVYSLQSQLRVGEAADNRPKSSSLNAYNLQAQLASAEAEARHKAASKNPYNLQAQVALGDTDVRHKTASQNIYSLQSQVGIGETDARNKAGHNSFSTQSHLGAGEKDSRYRGSQSVYSLQSQVGSVDTDAQHKARQQNVYNLQSQVASTAEAEARLKASHNAYSLQAQVGAYSQPSSLDGRQGRSSQWPLGSQQGNSQSAASMFVFPSVSGKNQSAQNSSNIAAWNASVSNVENWQKSAATGASAIFQQADLQQVENVDSRHQKAQSGSNSRNSSPQNENHLQSISSSRPPSRLGRPNSSLDASLSGTIGATPAKPTSLSHWQNHSSSNISSGNASQNDVLPTWSQGHTASPARGDVEKFNTGGDSTSEAGDVLPQWSREQESLPSQQDVDQVNNVLEESHNGPNEALPTWSRGQSLLPRKDLEQPNFGGESRIRSTNEAQPTSWPRGQNVLSQAQNNVEESSSGLQNEATTTWSRQQSVPARKGAEQLNLGELNSEMNEEDPWSRGGQSAYSRKDGAGLGAAGESKNATEELPIWSLGQQNKSARSVMDELDVGEESNSSRGNEVLPAWSRGQSTPARQEIEQSSFADETSRGSDLVPSWSRGVQSSAPSGRDPEELNVGVESNMGKVDALPAWSQGQQHVLSRKDAEQLNQVGDSNSAGTNRPVKEPLNARPEAEKRAQAEMSFLDRGTLRESNAAASPVPSPESNLFSSSAKQKPSTKTSSLSRNTLELLSRPEEPNESSSMNEEEMEEEDLDMEDSGVGISLAHLRRPGQASGPLSPQGFGLRLAPPSHLSQKSQDASRIVPTLSSGQEMAQSNPTTSGGNDPAFSDQMDTPVPNEAATSSLQAPATSTGTTPAPLNSQQDSHTISKESPLVETVERNGAPSGRLDGSISQQPTPSAPIVSPVAHQSFLGVQNSAETVQKGLSSKSTPAAQGMDQMVLEDGNATSNSYGSSQDNVMSHLTSSTPQKAQQHSSANANEQMQQQSGGVQTAALSRLLSTFKDQLSGQTKQPSAQQQGGNTERGNLGMFESAFRSQVGNKQVNGLQPGQWGIDPSQISSSVKAELLKRIAGQVQGKNQTSFGQVQPSSNSEQAVTGGETYLGNTASASHYLPGQQQAFAQSQIFPGQQSMASSQSQPGQQPSNQGEALQGQESMAASPRSGQMYNQGYKQPVQGIIMDKSSHQGYIHAQSHTLQGQPGIIPDQQHPMVQQSQNPSGQVSTSGQSYKGQAYTSGQALPGQVNAIGRSSYPGQAYNLAQGGGTPGKSFSQQGHTFAGHQSVAPGQTLPGPETPGQPVSGQVISPAMASKQSKARQQRKLPQKAVGNDLSEAQMQQGRVAPQQQSGGYPSQQQSLGFQHAQQSSSSAQIAPHEQHQYGQVPLQSDLSSSGQASQEDTTPSDTQPTFQPNEGLGSKDPRAGDSRGFGGADKPGAIPGNDGVHAPPPRSSLEQQFGARQDNNQGNLLQQWQNAQALNVQSGISDYQFQRVLEARPSIAAALEQYKGNPRLYQIATAQLRASLGQAQMARQMGQFQQQQQQQQQQAREQLSALSASTGAVRGPPLDGSAAAAQTAQASQQAVHAQVALAQGAQDAQSILASQAAQAQAVHNAQAAQAHAAAQAAEVFQAAQAVQAVQAAQAAQAAQAIHGAQSGPSADQAAQAAQAAIISKNANTAARLQYLSQIAQRGQNVNGMAASWFPGGGMVGRPGSNGPLLSSRMSEVGKGPDPTVAGAPTSAVVERPGTDFLQTSYAQPQPKKRKEPPTLPPWREVISQAGGYVSNMSGSELEWSAATNRIPDVEPRDEMIDVTDSKAVIISRAKRRLRLTTQLMQQITPAVHAMYMQSKAVEDRESATYLLSKLAFADACRISSIARRIREVAAARDAEESRIEKERELAMKEAERTGETTGRPLPLPANIADRFKLRIKQLETELQRLETSPSAVDLVKDMQDNERIGLVNRLAVHHSPIYSPHNADAPSKAVPQKYVTTVQMPNRLPDGLLYVSL